ncbi:MAG: hypothetical protein KJO81_04890 [Gammaproteobacteria bacterium]|nr:hypothetical protein [Gammaproteobacteria bacterium]
MKSYEQSEDAVSDAQLALERRDRSDRRRPSLKGFVYGLFLARRRGPRRAENLYHYSDWYDVKLLVLSLSLLLLSCLDAAMTMKLLSLGAVELNPIMNELINQGTRYFVWIKIAVTALCLIVLVAHNRIKLFNVFRVDVLLIAAVFIYLGLVTYEFYLYTLGAPSA